MLKITKEFKFEAAHMLHDERGNYNYGKCENLHGHSYILKVSLFANTPGENGMIMNFTQLKKMINELIIDKVDHSFLNETIPYMFEKENLPQFSVTTCENMSVLFGQLIAKYIDEYTCDYDAHINKIGIELWETATSNCYVEFEI